MAIKLFSARVYLLKELERIREVLNQLTCQHISEFNMHISNRHFIDTFQNPGVYFVIH